MEEKRKKLGMEILPSLRKRLKQKALELDRPMWAITQEALEAYLDDIKDHPAEDKDIARARYILEHGQEHHEQGFRTAIAAYYKDALANPREDNGGKRRRRKTG